MLKYSSNGTYSVNFSVCYGSAENDAPQNNTILQVFAAKIQYFNENGQIGTAVSYQSAVSSFVVFAGKFIFYRDITVEWLKRYEKFMLNAGKSFTTIGIYLRNLRTVFNEAIKAGFVDITQYPFGHNKDGKYEIPEGAGRKMALSVTQMKKVFEYSNNNDTIMQYVDLWNFSYLCNGANINDILRFKYRNIKGEEIFFLRGKTLRTTKKKREIVVFITSKMQKIIDKWGSSNKSSDNFIFPYLIGIEDERKIKAVIADVTKRINKRMKQVSQELALPNITTYTARHTFATILKRNGANIAYIAESLGHSDLKTTANYLASFETEERRKNAQLLTNF
jgi:integrase